MIKSSGVLKFEPLVSNFPGKYPFIICKIPAAYDHGVAVYLNIDTLVFFVHPLRYLLVRNVYEIYGARIDNGKWLCLYYVVQGQ